MIPSLAPGRAVLFFKARSIANGPGLVQRSITDTKGRVAKRWVRASDDPPRGRGRTTAPEQAGQKKPAAGAAAPSRYGQHNVQAGDTMAFQSGALQGHGRVKAAGKDGATIEDDSGRAHQVPWADVQGFKRQGGTAPGARPAQEGQGKAEPQAQAAKKAGTGQRPVPPAKEKAAGGEDERLQRLEATIDQSVRKAGMHEFFAAESQGLPAKVAGKFKSWQELEAAAPAAQKELEAILGKAGAALGGKSVRFDTYDYSQPGVIYGVGPVKTQESSARKVNAKYGGDWTQLGDLVRGSIGFDSVEEMQQGIEGLKAAGLKLATQAKNKFAQPTSEGYRDMNLNILLSNGVVGELQLHLKPILDAKNEGHSYYEESRVLQHALQGRQGTAGEPVAAYGDTSDTSDNKQKRLDGLVRKQRKLYGNAMARALGKPQAMVKALDGKMALFFKGKAS